MKRLIECVPNFSEGRDKTKVDAIVAAMSSVPGVYVLDREMDADHNRSVVTLAGEPEAVAEAALLGTGKAQELIDLTQHTGAHPRVGATDVVPTRGWAPVCCVRSISSWALPVPRSAASATASGSPASVTTERLWSASISRSST